MCYNVSSGFQCNCMHSSLQTPSKCYMVLQCTLHDYTKNWTFLNFISTSDLMLVFSSS